MIYRIKSFSVIEKKDSYSRSISVCCLEPFVQHIYKRKNCKRSWDGAELDGVDHLFQSWFHNVWDNKSSAIFERAEGVSEIDRSSFLGSVTSLTFGRGVTSASFQTEGNFCSLYKVFEVSHTGWARTSTYSFDTQFKRPSGPGAFCLLRCFKLLYTRWTDTSRKSGFFF